MDIMAIYSCEPITDLRRGLISHEAIHRHGTRGHIVSGGSVIVFVYGC